MKNVFLFVFALTFVLGFGQDASAYIGPGAGLSMLGAFWGLVVAVLAAVSFLLLWPIRKMFRKNAATPEAGSEDKAAP
jgi:membrane protein implicated in regulation of membrane protease activity